MATIRARKQVNGTTRYTAMVRLRKGKTVIHQETKTFAFRAAAEIPMNDVMDFAIESARRETSYQQGRQSPPIQIHAGSLGDRQTATGGR